MESSSTELIFDHVGHFGGFQVILYVICAYQNMACGIHYFSSVVMSVIPEHVLKKAVFHNFSAWRLEDILALLSPDQKDHITVELQNGEIWELTRCSRTWRENTSHVNYEYTGYKRDIPCSDGYVYDQSKWRNSVVCELNLVCDQKWYAVLIQPLFMFGVLLGAFIFVVLWSTSTGVFFFGIASVFTFDYYIFMAARFLLAMAAGGYLVVVFVYVMEFIGKKSRTWASIHLHTFFVIGIMSVALLGYLVRTQWLYQIILCTVTVPFIVCCWMLPETPFWLLSEGRYEEAQGLVNTMAVWNKSSSCDLVQLLSLDVNKSLVKNPYATKKHRLADLFHNHEITKMTLIIWLAWFMGCLGFYTFTLDSLLLEKHEYLHLFLLSAMEITTYFIVCILLEKVGRRNSLVFFLLSNSLICGVFMNNYVLKVVVFLAAKIAIGSAFELLYVYTAELYPTIVKCSAMGSSSMVSRISNIIVPFSGQFIKIWIFLPQFLVGILALLSRLLSLNLPETRDKLLTSSWEKTEETGPEKTSSSNISLPGVSNSDLGKMKVINLEES
uniref:Solute carrier family 22 (organic cation transporter), member 16 n=1 Tax=Nannospalax galili TaxID=1026970 RepID=A0A8C6RQM5_NANGA